MCPSATPQAMSWGICTAILSLQRRLPRRLARATPPDRGEHQRRSNSDFSRWSGDNTNVLAHHRARPISQAPARRRFRRRGEAVGAKRAGHRERRSRNPPRPEVSGWRCRENCRAELDRRAAGSLILIAASGKPGRIVSLAGISKKTERTAGVYFRRRTSPGRGPLVAFAPWKSTLGCVLAAAACGRFWFYRLEECSE